LAVYEEGSIKYFEAYDAFDYLIKNTYDEKI
jgi:hypothetical protein